jgi:hypothetical protein
MRKFIAALIFFFVVISVSNLAAAALAHLGFGVQIPARSCLLAKQTHSDIGPPATLTVTLLAPVTDTAVGIPTHPFVLICTIFQGENNERR